MTGQEPNEAAEEARARAHAETLGIRIDWLDGFCPVQAEGYFDSKAFYFRARHDSWSFAVGPPEPPWDYDEWEIKRDYGTGENAGWMPLSVAVGFICDGVAAYRSRVPREEGE